MKILNISAPRYLSCRILCGAGLIAGLVSSDGAVAQDMSTRAMSTRASAASEAATTRADEYKPLGVRAGSFYINPVVEAGLVVDSNVFLLPDEVVVKDPAGESLVILNDLRRSDIIATGSAQGKIRSDWNRHELNVNLGVTGGAYREYTSEDYLDYKITGNGRVDVMSNSFFKAKAGYMHLHQSRGALNNRGGEKPTEYDLAYLGVGYDHKHNRLGVGFDLDYVTLDFENVESVAGTTINNDQRDRDRTEATLRLAYELWSARSVFVQGAVNRVDYDQKFDGAGREKSSHGYKITAGMNFNLTSRILGDMFVGYVEQIYDDPIYDDLGDPLIGLGILWFPTELTTVTVDLDRNPQESASPRQAGYLSYNFRAGVNHELLRNLILVGGLRYVNNRYEQLTPEDKEKDVTYGFDFGVKYLFSRNLYIRSDYYFGLRKSDIQSQDYDVNRLDVTIGANW